MNLIIGVKPLSRQDIQNEQMQQLIEKYFNGSNEYFCTSLI